MTVPNPPSGTTPAGFDTWATTVATDVNANSDEIAALPGTYAPARFKLRSGYWYVPQVHSVVTGIRAEGAFEAAAFDVDASATLDRIACDITVAGSSGAVVRLGIYDTDANGTPGALVLDAGTVNGASTGILTIATSQAVAPGRYWLGAVSQGAAGTRPTLRVASGTSLPGVGAPGGGFIQFSARGYQMTGVSGALPGSFTIAAAASTTPQVAVRVA
jgi:hypothetical protein